MSTDGKATTTFSFVDFLVRLLAALALVLLTHNPTRYSYAQWLRGAISDGSVGAVHALAGVILLIGWTVFLRTAWASLGTLGLLLGAAFLAALIWVLVDYDLLSIASTSAVTWVLLVCVAALLAVGMSWAHWKRRASGQVEVDEIEH
jgi:hypothetical protein